MKKAISKITPVEIYKAETTGSSIEFIRMKDVFNMVETVLKVEYKNTEIGIIAKIYFENTGLNSTIKIC